MVLKKVPSIYHDPLMCRGVTRIAKTTGCALSGFVLVKKVPGTLHFLAKSASHSFDHGGLNMSHVVNYWRAPAAALRMRQGAVLAGSMLHNNSSTGMIISSAHMTAD